MKLISLFCVLNLGFSCTPSSTIEDDMGNNAKMNDLSSKSDQSDMKTPLDMKGKTNNTNNNHTNNKTNSGTTTTKRTLRYDGGFEKGNVEPWSLNMKRGKPVEYQFTIMDKNDDPHLVRQGKYSAKTVVHDGDEFLDTGGERCDLEFPENEPREVEGDDLWYAFSTLFPKNWKPLDKKNGGDWMVILDWHSTYWIDTNFDPCQHLQFELDSSDEVGIRMLTGNVKGYDCYTPPNDKETAYQFSKNVFKIRPGIWNDLVVHVKWSTKNGLVEIWHKFEDKKFKKVIDLHDIPTLQHIGDPNSAKSPYLILAHYRSAAQKQTKTIYHDGFRIAESANDLIEGDLYDLNK